MDRNTRILILEDNPADVELYLQALNDSGLKTEIRVVAHKIEFILGLERYDPDLVLVNFALPDYDGITAIRDTKAFRSFLPVIIITDSIGEETAVKCLKVGAADYILKSSLVRLGSAVRSALENKVARLEKLVAFGKLKESEHRYRTLFNSNLAGVFHASVEGRLLSCNPAFIGIFGYESCDNIQKKKTFDLFGYSAREATELIEKLNQGRSLYTELQVSDRQGKARWLLLSCTMVSENRTILGTVIDITERRLSEEKFRKLFHSIPDAISLTDIADGTILEVNDSFCRITGWDREALIGRRSEDLKLWSSPRDEFVSQLKQKGRVTDFVGKIRTRKGTRLTMMVSAETLELNQHMCILTVARDITRQIRIDRELKQNRKQLHDLSARLLRSQEDERRRISRELHDELGQALTVMELNFNQLEKTVSRHLKQIDRDRLHDTIKLIDHLEQQVRELSLELRPLMLDELGLVPTINWYVDRFRNRTGINVSTTVAEIDENVPDSMATAVFRILQESLTNILRHARADTVGIDLQNGDGLLTLTITDNGCGFNVAEVLNNPEPVQKVGLVGIRERAELLSGSFKIQSRPGSGTRLTVKIPCENYHE